MDYSKLPLFISTNHDIEVPFPRTMRFILKNYKWIAQEGHTIEEIGKIRSRDKKIGKTAIRLCKKKNREFMSKLQQSDYQVNLNNAKINIRVFSHKNRAPNKNPRILLHFHGGGWVYGDLEFYGPTCYKYAHYFNAIVVSVDYRKAPEYKFPIPFGDCLKFTEWILDNKSLFGGENTPIYLIGESAGGNLAAAISLYFRNHDINAISGQILLYPALDSTNDYPSVEKYKTDHLLTKESLEFYLDAYAATPEDLDNPYLAPIKAQDLFNYPPTTIITGSHDILRDQGYKFYQKLINDNVQAFYRNYVLALHGFLNAPELFFRGDEMYENFIDFVKESLFKEKQNKMNILETHPVI